MSCVREKISLFPFRIHYTAKCAVCSLFSKFFAEFSPMHVGIKIATEIPRKVFPESPPPPPPPGSNNDFIVAGRREVSPTSSSYFLFQFQSREFVTAIAFSSFLPSSSDPRGTNILHPLLFPFLFPPFPPPGKKGRENGGCVIAPPSPSFFPPSDDLRCFPIHSGSKIKFEKHVHHRTQCTSRAGVVLTRKGKPGVGT